MKDKDFLIWIYTRLHQVHGESEILDYMCKLRAIIEATGPDITTLNISVSDLHSPIIEV